MAVASIAIAITLDNAHEGGFQKNPNDRANWTGGRATDILAGTAACSKWEEVGSD